MKKMFTLIALLAMFLSASAKVEIKIDAETNFAEKADGPSDLAAWGGGECLSFQNGLLHFHSDEAKANPWDVQFFPIASASLDADLTYTIEFKIKGTGGPIFNMAFAGVDKYGVYEVPGDGEWHIAQVEYKPNDPTKNGGGVLFQCGAYVGDWDMEYMKITHEENVSDREIEWVEQIVNGDASGEYGEVPCVQTKVWNVDPEIRNIISPAQIESQGDNKVFVCHALEVNPVLVWDADGEQWGVEHKAGDPMPDNAWQNQMWIVFPKAYKAGEQINLSFRYKASKAVKVDTQSHGEAGNYIGNGPVGQLSFTTEWKTFSKIVSVDDNQQSIAFNLGSDIYDQDIDFYLDDVKAASMKLDEGLFIASANTETPGLVQYDFDNAAEFDLDLDLGAYVTTVGTEGKMESWVNEVMISTVRGVDRSFKANTISGKFSSKSTLDNPEFTDYTAASNAKIKLPALGVWMIVVDPIMQQFTAIQVEGNAPKQPIDVVANPTHVVINGVEREYKSVDEAPEGYVFKTEIDPDTFEEKPIVGNDWDNQFVLVANRPLEVGEETYVEFKYKATKPATVGTQCGGADYVGQYVHYAALDNIEFTAEEQVFRKEFTVPAEANGMKAFNFNMAILKDANVYEIYDVIWKLTDNTETLINMEGAANFFVKEGAGTAPYQFGTDPSAVVTVDAAAKTAKGIVNLAGQQVTKNYKGIVIMNGNKYLAK